MHAGTANGSHVPRRKDIPATSSTGTWRRWFLVVRLAARGENALELVMTKATNQDASKARF